MKIEILHSRTHFSFFFPCSTLSLKAGSPPCFANAAGSVPSPSPDSRACPGKRKETHRGEDCCLSAAAVAAAAVDGEKGQKLKEKNALSSSPLCCSSPPLPARFIMKKSSGRRLAERAPESARLGGHKRQQASEE